MPRWKTPFKEAYPEYVAWRAMRQRCLYPKHRDYQNYGGRGITVCARWVASFDSFLGDMGRRPGLGYSLGRKDNTKGYSKANCRWETQEQQQNNRRSNRLIVVQGKLVTLAEAERLIGLSKGVLKQRLRMGVEQSRILEKDLTPRGERAGSSKLTEAQVLQIRSRLAGKLAKGDVLKIAKEFSVCRHTIQYIGRGLIWAHLK